MTQPTDELRKYRLRFKGQLFKFDVIQRAVAIELDHGAFRLQQLISVSRAFVTSPHYPDKLFENPLPILLHALLPSVRIAVLAQNHILLKCSVNHVRWGTKSRVGTSTTEGPPESEAILRHQACTALLNCLVAQQRKKTRRRSLSK